MFITIFYLGGTVMEQKKIDRINELSRKAKECTLTPEEIEEQKMLRAEYIALFRKNMKSQLDGIKKV